MRSTLPLASALLLLVNLWTVSHLTAANRPTTRQWTIGGVEREALVYAPAGAATQPAPLVFAFHGHGGSHRSFAGRMSLHTAWPEAIVVYPNGLNTPGRLSDPQGKRPGWQSAPGEQNDRDLKFFDAMLESMRQDYRVDEDRIYATGHSNGGTMTYVLWQTRGEKFAALAPMGTALGMVWRQPDAVEFKLGNTPRRPMLHVAGENDPLVKFAWQQRTIEGLRRLYQCGDGKPWGEKCTIYPSPNGEPIVTYIHAGGHEIAPAAAMVVTEFFKQFPRPRTTSPGSTGATAPATP